MTDTLFEQLGGTYTQIGDYLLPDLSLPAEKDDRPIGIWGQRRLRYLKQYHKVIYYNLLTSGKLHTFVAFRLRLLTNPYLQKPKSYQPLFHCDD